MTLMFPPEAHRANDLAELTVERLFRIQLRCVQCRKEATADVEMVDAFGEAGTEEDFYRSGAASRLEPYCQHCGSGAATIVRIGYVRKPIDLV